MMTSPSPSNKPGNRKQSQPGKSPSPGPGMSPAMLALLAVLGVGVFAILPRMGQHTSPQTQQANPEAATVTIQNDNDDQGTIHAFWSLPVSQQQFWFDGVPAAATCDEHSCTVQKRRGIRQIYFRWFNTSLNQWYYFQCPADYRGQFQGIPYTSK